MGYLEKPLSMALSSQQSVASLYQMHTQAAKLYASMITVFSSFLIIIKNLQIQQATVGDIGYGSVTQPTGVAVPITHEASSQPSIAQTFEPVVMAPLPRFILNLSLAKRTIADLATKQLNQPTKLPSIPQPATSRAAPPLSKTQLTAEPNAILLNKIVELETSLESSLAPSLKIMASAIEEYELRTYQQTPSAYHTKPIASVSESTRTLPKYMLPFASLATLTALSSYQLAGAYTTPIAASKALKTEAVATGRTRIPETPHETTSGKIATSQTVVKQQGQRQAISDETEQQVSEVANEPVGLNSKTLSTIGFATILPALLMSNSGSSMSPSSQAIVRPKTQLLQPAISSYPRLTMVQSTAAISARSAPPSSGSPISINVQRMQPSATAPRVKDKSAASVDESKQVMPKALGKVVFNFGVYAAMGKLIAEATQAIGKMLSSTDENTGLLNPAASQFHVTSQTPQIATSFEEEKAGLAPSYSLAENISSYPFKPKETGVQLNVLASRRITQAQPGQFAARPSGALVLASAGTLIVHQLQSGLAAFKQESEASSSRLQEVLANRSLVGPTEEAAIKEIPEAADAGQQAPYISREPHAPLELPPLVASSPTVQDTINVTVSADTSEQDLRDLEQKINRILNEQLNRYYGSSRIGGT